MARVSPPTEAEVHELVYLAGQGKAYRFFVRDCDIIKDSDGRIAKLPEGVYSAGFAFRVGDVSWENLEWLPKETYYRVMKNSLVKSK
jgi:hypothetical protein